MTPLFPSYGFTTLSFVWKCKWTRRLVCVRGERHGLKLTLFGLKLIVLELEQVSFRQILKHN